MAVRCFPRLILLDAATVVGYSPVAKLLSAETINGILPVQERFSQAQEHGAPLLWYPV